MAAGHRTLHFQRNETEDQWKLMKYRENVSRLQHKQQMRDCPEMVLEIPLAKWMIAKQNKIEDGPVIIVKVRDNYCAACMFHEGIPFNVKTSRAWGPKSMHTYLGKRGSMNLGEILHLYFHWPLAKFYHFFQLFKNTTLRKGP